ncbi:MAG: hypothetical protein Q8M94_19055 [Ignavibacteria bacterium]|nr:hypothetical protein [Ignavibacteria bacterium]
MTNEEEITIEDIDKLDKSLAIQEGIQEDADMDGLIASFQKANVPQELHNNKKEN